MKKLIQGIIDFRKHRLAEYREKFSQLALGQAPDTLFIACSDSRVVPNLFASTDPGDLFVIRNVGNLIPPCNAKGQAESDGSAWAAIEFAIQQLHVSDIIVCGHSECGAIKAILEGGPDHSAPHLKGWLEYGAQAASQKTEIDFSTEDLTETNKVSQANVLLQLTHLKTYPPVQKGLQDGKLQLHGWWFDIGSGNVYAFDESSHAFQLIAS